MHTEFNGYQVMSSITTGAITAVSNLEGDRMESFELGILRRYPGTPEEAAETLAVAHSWSGCDESPEMRREASAAIANVIVFLGGVSMPAAGYYGIDAAA